MESETQTHTVLYAYYVMSSIISHKVSLDGAVFHVIVEDDDDKKITSVCLLYMQIG